MYDYFFPDEETEASKVKSLIKRSKLFCSGGRGLKPSDTAPSPNVFHSSNVFQTKLLILLPKKCFLYSIKFETIVYHFFL